MQIDDPIKGKPHATDERPQTKNCSGSKMAIILYKCMEKTVETNWY